ncbi:hypothetical protein CkaCkLH20_03750 [Colletotrichum karsti]|uniref:Uncharacterized protein n=1 Tax=Colletotrichum karsti TaxID=1095194 RepID=A0A9P6LMV7_9PEZI|nr:uncharacterized protein CkaCkLH20_03750 [Colletotrichum karsti]KAF9878850.1 hypothetical protein CkaCkLH20_03750 [Colletotrichum karsti]
MPPASSKPRPVVLGIDWGSTGVRLMLFHTQGNHLNPFEPVRSKETPRHEDKRYGGGAYKATLAVFDDDGEVYTPDKECRGRKRISSKFLFKDGGSLDPNHPLAEEIKRLSTDEAFRKRCENGKLAIIKTFVAAIEDICEKKNLEVVDVGLSIPATWTCEEIEEYRRLLRMTFRSRTLKMAFRNAQFHTEVESFAHYFMWHMNQTKESLVSEDTIILYIDFGGYSMSGCLFQVRKLKSDPETSMFYRVGEPFGCAGGTEHWEAYVSQWCTRETMEHDNFNNSRSFLTEDDRCQLLDNFHRQVVENEHSSFEDMLLHLDNPSAYSSHHRSHSVTVPANTSRKMFYNSMQDSLEMTNERIAKLGVFPKGSVKVIVTGGSAKHFQVQKKLREQCLAASIPEPIFVHEESNDYAAFNVARGAALASAKTCKVGSFMSNGAAFGIQMLQEEESMWDNYAGVVLKEKGPQDLRFYSSGKDRLKLICDPFHRARGGNDQIHHSKAYDIVELPPAPKGEWRYSLDNVGDQMATDMHLNTANTYLLKVKDRVENAHRGLAIWEDGTIVACREERTAEAIMREELLSRMESGNAAEEPATPEPAPRTPKRRRGRKPSGHLQEIPSHRVTRGRPSESPEPPLSPYEEMRSRLRSVRDSIIVGSIRKRKR